MANYDDFDFGMEDLDAFDFDDPFDTSSKKGGKKPRTPIEDFTQSAASEAVSTARNRLINPGVMRRLLAQALPKGYSQVFNAYDALKSGVADTYKENQNELDPYLRKAKVRLDRMGPMAKRLVPKELRDAIEDAENAGQSRSYHSDPDAELNGNIAGIEKLLAAQSRQRLEDTLNNATADIRQRKQFGLEISALADIGKGIGRLVGYQDKVTISYQRKSLEIGYRQLDVAVKTMRAQQSFHADAKALLDAVRHNTALPDFVKMRTTEVVKQQIANRLTQSAIQSAGGWANNYFTNIRKNASGYLNGALSGAAALGDASDQMGASRAQMAGMATGQFVGQAGAGLLEWLGETLASQAAPYLARIPGLTAGGAALRRNLNGIPQRLNEYAKSETTSTGWFGLRGLAEENLKAMLDRHSPTSMVNGKQLRELDQPAMFDTLFHRSVTEIMPGYLASIDRTLRSLYSGQDEEENAYSHYVGGFVSRSTLNQQHARIALKGGDRGGLRSQVDTLLREMGADRLSDLAKRALRRQLMKDMSAANDFKPDRYVKVNTWSHLDQPIAEELIEFFADTFGLAPDGRLIDHRDEIRDKTADVREMFLDLTQRIPDYGSTMDILQDVAGRRTWRELGLTTYNGLNSDIINLDAVYDLLVNDSADDNLPPEKKKEKKKFKVGSREDMIRQLEEAAAAAREEMRKKKKQAGPSSEEVDTIAKTRGNYIGPRPPGPIPPAPTPGPAPVLPPITVTADVKFPDMFKTEDEKTHARLESMVSLMEDNNGWLEFILDAVLAQGSGGGGGGPGDVGPGPTPGPGPAPDDGGGGGPDSRRRRGMMSRLWGGTKMLGRGLRSYMKTSYSLMWKGTKFAGNLGLGALKFPFKSRGLGVTDVYVQGDPEPAMTARKIRAGQYRDVNTNKVIQSIADITGEVRDYQNNVIITQAEFEQGLMSGEGESLAGWGLRTGASLTGSAVKGIGRYFGATYGAIWKGVTWSAKKLFGGEGKAARTDVYFPGEDKPRIRVELMDRDWYRDKDNNVIKSLDDINGAVYTPYGDVVISEEELQKFKGLYKRDGSLAWRLGSGMVSVAGGAGRLAIRGAKAYGRLVGKFYKGMWKATKGAFRLAGRMVGIGRGNSGGEGTGSGDEDLNTAMFEVALEQLNTQRGIYDMLKKSWDDEHVRGDFDGDGLRENGWQDILKRRKGRPGPVAAAGAGATGEAIDRLGETLEKKLDELIETTEEAGESSLLEDAADLADIGDAAGDSRERRRRRGGRRGPPRPPRGGRLARFGSMLKNGASWLGRGALAALPFLGEAAMAGASAIGGVLSAPVVLGAIAVAGIAYLGYRYYKGNNAKDFPLLYLRMTQYGVSPTDKARVEQMIKLESIVLPNVKITSAGAASIDPQGIDYAGIYKMLGINGTERENKLAMWLQQRFKPVLLAHAAAMKNIRGTTELSSADTSLGDGDLEAFLNMVDLGGMQDVYDDTETSPFDGDLDTDADDVADAVKFVRERRSQAKGTAAAAAAVGVATGAAALAGRNTTLPVSPNGTSNVADIENTLKITRRQTAIGAVSGTYTATGLGVTSLKSLDVATAVRFITYGLKELRLDYCKQLQAVEAIYWPKVRYSGTAAAVIEGDLGEYEAQVIDVFKPESEPAKEDIKRWLSYRFLPTFLQYCISIRRRYNGFAQDGSTKLTGPDLRDVLNETTAAKSEVATGSVAVWSIENSPWLGVQLETMSGAVKRYIDSLDTGDTSKVLSVNGLKDQENYADKNKSYQERLTNTALGNTRTQNGSLGRTGGTLANYGKIYGQGAQAGGVTGQSTTGKGTGSLLMAGVSIGNAVVHPGGGTGGDINSLPEPADDSNIKSASERWKNVKDVILGAAKMVGVDPALMATIGGTESAFKIKAGAGTSSAKGLYQFTSGTWSSMMKKYGATYGIAPNATPFDPRANAILGACYVKENYDALSKTLNGKVTDTDLYMAHFLGTNGAKRFLTADRSAPSDQHVGDGVVSANQNIFIEKGTGRIRSVGEVIQYMSNSMDRARKMHDMGTGGAAVDSSVSSPAGTSTGAAGKGAASVTDEVTGAAADTPAGHADTGPALPSVADGATAAASNAANSSVSGDTPPPVSPMPTRPSAPADDAQSAPAQASTASAPSTPTRAAVENNQRNQAQQQSAFDTSIGETIKEHLAVAKSSDSTLKAIDGKMAQLATLIAQRGSNAPAAAPAAPPEPAPRNTVNTKRRLAET